MFLHIKSFLGGWLLLASELMWSAGDENCRIENLEIVNADFKVQLLRYHGSLSKKKSIIIVPPTGGVNILDRGYARLFCKSGFEVFVVDRWTNDDEYSYDLDIHERFYQRAVKAAELLINNINSNSIGLLGTSVGAIHAANIISKFSEIDAAFLITGGGPIPEVIANTDQGVLVQAKEERFKQFSFKTSQDYIKALEGRISFNPLRGALNSKIKIGLVVANRDFTVPSKNQKLLRDSLSPAKVIEIDNNHFVAIMKTWFLYRDEILEFFM